MEAIKYIVGIQCMTYNHSRYILDTLNGFVLQETNFPYIILLVDDASTDGTPDIIGKYIEQHFNLNDNIITGRTETEYAHILYTQHKTNKNCHIVSMSLKYNHYQIGRKADKLRYLSEWINDCKYMALCEGDDYWIDSNKLKKQIDFLESHIEYTMCFHNAIEHFEDVDGQDRIFSKVKDKDYLGHYIFKNWIIPTASVVFRRSVYDSDIYKRVLESSNFIYGDTPLFCACAHIGKIRGFSDKMSVYRRHVGGMTFNTDAAKDFRIARHQQEFYNVFGKKYKSPLLISYYYSCSLIRSFFKFNWDKCKEIIAAYPYRGYIVLSIIVTPFMYLKYLLKR